ncbi:MAG TPA: tetratricopeptide repeat protein, partial [Planctomycetota bacterium]|nr:tetratricopeptide repeat protein [Planctomycetota bacterium]
MALPAASSKLVERAREAAKKKNYDYAIELYLEHLKVTPADVDARRELRLVERERFKVNPPGMLQRAKNATNVAAARSMPISKKDPEKSMISCEETLRSDPNAVPVLLKLGEAASYANLNDVAIAVFEDALSIDRAHIEGNRLLGRVYRATGALDKALVCFERLHKAAPQDQEASNMVRDIPAQMTSAKVTGTDGKVKGYQDLIDKDAAKKLEQLSARVRTPEQARERITAQLAQIEANDGKADNKTWRLMAEWAVLAKEYEQAIEFFDKALAEKPDDFQAKEGKGDIKIKRYRDTMKKLEDAHKKTPDDANIKAKLEKVTK